ncbi:MAG: VanZ family protein [Clostridia bacterium]|nr:VanZ family protein [Clostridia bacterium]
MRITKKQPQYRLCLLLFAAYALLMLWLLFGQRADRLGGEYTSAVLRAHINLLPGRTIAEFWHDLRGGARVWAIIQLFGNVIMFVPLGLFIPAVFPRAAAFWRTVLWSAVTVLSIELIQLFTLLGSLDIDDLILNLLGAAIGYALYRLLRRALEQEIK